MYHDYITRGRCLTTDMTIEALVTFKTEPVSGVGRERIRKPWRLALAIIRAMTLLNRRMARIGE